MKWSFGKINLFVLKCFYFFKHKRDITLFLKTSRVTFFLKVLITNAGPCGYFNAISEKHLRYSLFVKRIIAIEAQLYFLGLAWSDYNTAMDDTLVANQCNYQVLRIE